VDALAGNFTLTLSAQTTGWIGFGLAEAGGMAGADILVASVDDNGVGTVGDYWASANAAPHLDTQQDWRLLSASEADGVTSVTVTRALDTNDRQDRPFAPWAAWKNKVIVATGESDTFAYHGTASRRADAIDFFGVTRDTLAELEAEAGYFTYMMPVPNYTVPERCLPNSPTHTPEVPCVRRRKSNSQSPRARLACPTSAEREINSSPFAGRPRPTTTCRTRPQAARKPATTTGQPTCRSASTSRTGPPATSPRSST
jgi:hypothetical protein